MSEPIVFDSSAVLTILKNEPGRDVVEQALGDPIISAVNLTEAISKLIDHGGDFEGAVAAVDSLALTVVPFDEELALSASRLRADTRHLGLSLGDRACLALAMTKDLPVLTADRIWASLDLGIEIRLVR